MTEKCELDSEKCDIVPYAQEFNVDPRLNSGIFWCRNCKVEVVSQDIPDEMM